MTTLHRTSERGHIKSHFSKDLNGMTPKNSLKTTTKDLENISNYRREDFQNRIQKILKHVTADILALKDDKN